ncbi:SpoIID/LytB domain-containing protein [Vallicoccus soli]|uniref:SpoIID/LytB domain-containing protein n=1 Tax=Vallicoccus soli TaxID=2339232 RepID=A0A3A3ZIM0_9ACTN|nr:SpoIID/LytB domain-containing protein [Vallicoccus soli]RJK95366.1 SpoIID/LytB domain-containing protein [Vallicoccus soli]
MTRAPRRGPVLGAALLGLLAAALQAPAGGPAAAAGCTPPGGRTVPEAAAPAGAEVTVLGHGWGHGLGMSQYGAQGAARLGCDHVRILQTYYTGTRVVRRDGDGSPVLLSLLRGAARTTVAAETGTVAWQVRGTSAAATQPAGSTWTVVRSGGSVLVRDAGGTTRLTAADGRELRAVGTLVRLRAYGSGSAPVTDLRLRDDYTTFTRAAGIGTDVVQVFQDDSRTTGVQKYLRGLREVPVSWPQEALRAQAVAARTYLLRAHDAAAGGYRLSATTASQVYAGAAHEDEDARWGGGWRTAVDATAGEVVVDGAGRLIDALYSSSAGGWTSDRQYVWGSYGTPYLVPVDDSAWDLASDNPYRSWSRTFTRAEVARALGFDAVLSLALAPQGDPARRDGVRVTAVDDGRAVTRSVTGDRLRTALGLRSPGVEFAAPPPPPPPPSSGVTAPVVGDWDGDGRDDVGWYRSGTWSLRAGDGSVRRFPFGRATDVPVVGDWDGDGRDGVGVFRAGQWFLRDALSRGPHDVALSFGRAGDQPVTGSWTGRRGDGVGVVRQGRWSLRQTLSTGPAGVEAAWGRPADRAVPGDWDGDGRATPGLRRSTWFFLSARSDAPRAVASVAYGRSAARAVAGDWDGDGRDTPGVVSGTTWQLRDDLRGGTATRTVRFDG